jgi:uncharacterized protein with GYD domain
MACVEFAKSCKEPQHKLAALMAPIESVTGETTDISEYLDFGFYDSVWYHENAGW